MKALVLATVIALASAPAYAATMKKGNSKYSLSYSKIAVYNYQASSKKSWSYGGSHSGAFKSVLKSKLGNSSKLSHYKKKLQNVHKFTKLKKKKYWKYKKKKMSDVPVPAGFPLLLAGLGGLALLRRRSK